MLPAGREIAHSHVAGWYRRWYALLALDGADDGGHPLPIHRRTLRTEALKPSGPRVSLGRACSRPPASGDRVSGQCRANARVIVELLSLA